MGVKHKKTRKQKITADLHRNVYTFESKQTSYPTAPTAIDTVSYVLHDVTKTAFLTFSIIAAEIILFFLLKNHIITLSKISY